MCLGTTSDQLETAWERDLQQRFPGRMCNPRTYWVTPLPLYLSSDLAPLSLNRCTLRSLLINLSLPNDNLGYHSNAVYPLLLTATPITRIACMLLLLFLES